MAHNCHIKTKCSEQSQITRNEFKSLTTFQITHSKFKSSTANYKSRTANSNHPQQITNHVQQIQITHSKLQITNSKFKSPTANYKSLTANSNHPQQITKSLTSNSNHHTNFKMIDHARRLQSPPGSGARRQRIFVIHEATTCEVSAPALLMATLFLSESLTNWCQCFMRLSSYWSWISS